MGALRQAARSVSGLFEVPLVILLSAIEDRGGGDFRDDGSDKPA